MPDQNKMVLDSIQQLYDSLFQHDGYGEMKIEMKFLKKGQKEIIIHCGKQYRYVVDWPEEKGCTE
ncbi:hypothetical protein [Tindallia californiensis]|uniref:Uncharacterized protein n=1 Tax=Tindallia californiensis TaxID=159292 RepID=A0A1H3MD34_9FIRM|nr:hypothetical protein [Tindallia californiensis]SDY74208.1 hypothetical protein SAMN05192546_10476 [Tindallia californiensis]